MIPENPPSEEMRQLARQVLAKNVGLKKGESVVIEAWSNSLPYAEAMQMEARRMGATPLVLYESEPAYWDAVDSAPQTIGNPGRPEWAALENADAYIYFWGPANRARLASLPDKKRQAIQAYNPKWYEVAGKKGVRGFRMEVALAEPENAERHGVDLEAWRKELISATFVDPKELAREGAKVAKAFEKGKSVRITHPNGTDLTLGLKHRKAIVQDGRIDDGDRKRKLNVDSLPAGAAIVALDEKVADGVLVSNRPMRVAGQGYTAEGARWAFKDGKLVSYSYESGGDRWTKPYAAAPKGKDQPGLLEIGLNRLMRDAPTFEDQELGTVTVYIGGNVAYGGANKCPYIGYTMIREPVVEVDGKVLVSEGKIR